MDIAALIVSFVAVLVAGSAAWYTRGQKVAADRAADAAEASLELARTADARALEDAQRVQVVWQLERTSQQAYVLHNHGTHAAHAVYVDLADLKMNGGGAEYIEEFAAGHAEQYFLARGLSSTTTSIVVTWHQSPDHSDEARKQSLHVVF